MSLCVEVEMKPEDLQPKYLKVLEFISNFDNENEYSPSVRDIQDGCGISSTSVTVYRLEHLETIGMLKRTPGRSRSVVLTKPGLRAILKQKELP